MSGNNGDDKDSDGELSDDSKDSWFPEGEEIVLDPKTNKYKRATGTIESKEQHAQENQQLKTMLFSEIYQKARSMHEAEEQKLRDAVKAKVDSITILLQEHASKSSYAPSEQSASTEVGNPERPLEAVVKQINDLISDVRRQYINNARRGDIGMTVLDQAMMVVLSRLQTNLKNTPYGDILDKFLEEEIVVNATLISKGDSTDPFLHYLFEHPEDKAKIGDDIYNSYRDAFYEYFISSSDSNLISVRVAEAGINDVLGRSAGPGITAMSVALATAAEARNSAPNNKSTPHTRLE
jgi:hypothetical protein